MPNHASWETRDRRAQEHDGLEDVSSAPSVWGNMTESPESIVVGGHGFIGSALAARLERIGASVERAGRDATGPASASLDRIAQARTIFWSASSVNPKIAAESPEAVAADRAAFSGFLDALDARRSTARVVLFSSGGTVYGDARPPFSESTTARPTSAYGRVKLALEQTLLERRAESVVVRISNAYGPGQRPAPGQGVIGHWLRALARREPIEIYGSLDAARDYVYIDDLVDALIAVARSGELPPVLNLGSGTPTTLGEILQVVEAVSHEHPADVRHMPARSFDLEQVWLDTRLAKDTLGWTAGTDLATGITAMWRWALAVGDWHQ